MANTAELALKSSPMVGKGRFRSQDSHCRYHQLCPHASLPNSKLTIQGTMTSRWTTSFTPSTVQVSTTKTPRILPSAGHCLLQAALSHTWNTVAPPSDLHIPKAPELNSPSSGPRTVPNTALGPSTTAERISPPRPRGEIVQQRRFHAQQTSGLPSPQTPTCLSLTRPRIHIATIRSVVRNCTQHLRESGLDSMCAAMSTKAEAPNA
jgi:hypothetical protein